MDENTQVTPEQAAIDARAAELLTEMEDKARAKAEAEFAGRTVRTLPHAGSADEANTETQTVRSEAIVAAPRFGQRHVLQVVQQGAEAVRTMLRDVLGAATGTDYQAVVPVGFTNDVLLKLGELTPLATNEFAYIVPMSGEVQRVPVLAARPKPSKTARARGEEHTAGTSAAFGSVELVAREWGDCVDIEKRMLEDSPVALYELLVQLFAQGMAEVREDLFFNGDGETQPEGVLTHIAAQVSEATNGVELAAEVEGVYFGLKAAYRTGAVWFVSARGLQKLSSLRDANGNKLIGNPTQEQPFAKLMGLPIFETSAIEDGATTKLVLGNFRYGYVIGKRQGLQVAADYSVGFRKGTVAVKYDERIDGRIGQADAIKVLEFAL